MVVHNRLHLHAHRVQIAQVLKPDDEFHRLRFAKKKKSYQTPKLMKFTFGDRYSVMKQLLRIRKGLSGIRMNQDTLTPLKKSKELVQR
jgi:hypothetical protein